jgi:hypothetical protein
MNSENSGHLCRQSVSPDERARVDPPSAPFKQKLYAVPLCDSDGFLLVSLAGNPKLVESAPNCRRRKARDLPCARGVCLECSHEIPMEARMNWRTYSTRSSPD